MEQNVFGSEVVDDSMNIASSRHNSTAAQNSQDELTETNDVPKTCENWGIEARENLYTEKGMWTQILTYSQENMCN